MQADCRICRSFPRRRGAWASSPSRRAATASSAPFRWWRVPRTSFIRRFPSESLRTAQGAGTLIVKATGASGEADTGTPAMTALKIGDFEVPTGPAGEFWVYYSGLPSIAPISAARILDPATAAGTGRPHCRPYRPRRHQRHRPARHRGDPAGRRRAGRDGPRRGHRPDHRRHLPVAAGLGARRAKLPPPPC